MIQEAIRQLINKRTDKPCMVIPGYTSNPQPKKPFAAMYLISDVRDDAYDSDVEIKTDDEVTETTKYWGEFTFQFDVLGNTDEETRTKADELLKLITYKMRYSDWQVNNIGITNPTLSITNRNEKVDREYIYRYTFDITFESEMSQQRVTQLAKKIEGTANSEKFIVGG